ncbi:MAG: T9SS type A sorting domain-containing protein [Crocinitomicaceae bacterium]|nr:T9SS type A sorting domain-containing protein [Crocinitomicaceae bacterium]
MKFFSLLLFTFIYFLSTGQTVDFAKFVGGNNIQKAYCTAVDSEKNIIVVGESKGSMDADPSVNDYFIAGSSSVSFPDAFVAKYDSLGNFIWANSTGGDYEDVARSVDTDSQGNIIVTGFYRDIVDIDPGIIDTFVYGNSQWPFPFLQKFDPNGNLLWHKHLDIGSSEIGTDVIIDSDDNIIWGVHGDTWSHTVDIGGVDSTFITEGDHLLIYKMAPNGDGLWAYPIINTAVNSRIWSLEIAPNNSILVGGEYAGIDIDFDIDPNQESLHSSIVSNNTDPFCMKIDQQGNFIWFKEVVNYFTSFISDAANVYDIKCDSQGSINLLTYTLLSGLTQHIIKTDSLGTLLFDIKNPNALSESYGNGFSMDPAGNLYSLFDFVDSADVDPGPGIIMEYAFGNCNNEGSVIQKFNPSGDLVWAIPFQKCNGQIHDIHCDSDGTLMFSGRFGPTLDLTHFGGTELTNGLGDFLISRIEQDLCSDFTLSFDNIPSLECSSSTFIGIEVSGGTSPYDISFNSLPNDTLTEFPVQTPGLYSISVSDQIGCMRNKNILVPGPTIPIGFDLDAHLVTSQFRPGFETTVYIDAFSDGCDTVSGNLKLVLDTNVDLINMTPNANYTSGDTLIWNYPAMNYDSTHFTPVITLKTHSSALIGDSVFLNLFISPVLGDFDSTNNSKVYGFEIKNGYDPNDKKVYPKEKCDLGYIKENQILTYTIRFQNTGNSEAINILVKDSIITENLDLSTLRVVSSSHDMYTEIIDNTKLHFVFDSIMLPDSTSNLIESQGYVIFEARPQQGLQHNTTILNTAGIYFDFNPVINTNTVTNTVFIGNFDDFDCITADLNSIVNEDFLIYPNPTNNNVSILFNNEQIDLTIYLLDIKGSELRRFHLVNGKIIDIDLPANSGIYFIKFTSDGENYSTKRIVKM